MSDTGPIAVVTGASRGAGVGIAHALGSHGCTVYVTGRTEVAGESPLPGTIHETAELVTALGGKGIAVRVDHGDDDQVKALFDQVKREQGALLRVEGRRYRADEDGGSRVRLARDHLQHRSAVHRGYPDAARRATSEECARRLPEVARLSRLNRCALNTSRATTTAEHLATTSTGTPLTIVTGS